MKRAVLLIGASGVFGGKLARRLAAWPDMRLILAGRRAEPLQALADELGAEAQVFDRDRPDPSALAVFAVIDCAGPFQGAGYELARAALAAGAHVIDIADSRAYVSGFPAAVDEAAKAAGRAAITGASSTPALSHAALDSLTAGWREIDSVRVAISPAARTPQGMAAVRGILSWVGQPVRVFAQGRWQVRRGWSMTRRAFMPGLGRRWQSLAETPDLDLLAERYQPRREALFLAGLESSFLHLGLAIAAQKVRLRIVGSLVPFARPMKAVAGVFALFGSKDGGMIATAEGRGAAGEPIAARWSLVAANLEGPHVPTLAVSATLRRLLDGQLAPGAQACAGFLQIDEIMREAEGLAVSTRTDARLPDEPGLFRRLMGPAFDALPGEVRRVHAGKAPETFHGRAIARGSGGLATLGRAFAGIRLGRVADFSVEITPQGDAEVWTRRFGRGRFRSVIRDVPRELARFTERLGPFSFELEARPGPSGFRWEPVGWRIGPVPLPRFLAPTIRAHSFESAGVYRFSVLVAHPWAGLIVGYAGRLA